jgi:NADH-quinone oxidoreductase subunit H
MASDQTLAMAAGRSVLMLEFLADVFTGIYEFLLNFLTVKPLTLEEPVAIGIIQFLGAFAVANFVLLLLIFNIWFERKVIARMQDRIGPNRVGPWGLLQTVADLGKLLTKEIIIPQGADLIPFMFAPILAVASVILIWAVIPFAQSAIGTDLNIGALYFVAAGSLGVMAILMAGWSSNNKYALLGAFRAVAMLVSYEVPVILTLLVPVLLSGTMRMNEIVADQRIWYFVAAPIAGLIFWIASVAEVGRTPFDLLEAESEIVAGYHIEYSGFAFAMFYAAEWAHGFAICALMATLFFGGWRGPFVDQVPTLGVLYFLGKTFIIYFFQTWTRATLPRLRIDQVMNFCWKFLVPLSLILIILMVVVDKIAANNIPDYMIYLDPGFREQSNARQMIAAMLPRTMLMLVVNLVVAGIALAMIARQGRREREALALRVAAIEPGFMHQQHQQAGK